MRTCIVCKLYCFVFMRWITYNYLHFTSSGTINSFHSIIDNIIANLEKNILQLQ